MYSNDLGGTLPLQMPKKKNTRYPNQQFTDADMYAIAMAFFGGFTTMLAPPMCENCLTGIHPGGETLKKLWLRAFSWQFSIFATRTFGDIFCTPSATLVPHAVPDFAATDYKKKTSMMATLPAIWTTVLVLVRTMQTGWFCTINEFSAGPCFACDCSSKQPIYRTNCFLKTLGIAQGTMPRVKNGKMSHRVML